jgi:hypothetical protein
VLAQDFGKHEDITPEGELAPGLHVGDEGDAIGEAQAADEAPAPGLLYREVGNENHHAGA